MSFTRQIDNLCQEDAHGSLVVFSYIHDEISRLFFCPFTESH